MVSLPLILSADGRGLYVKSFTDTTASPNVLFPFIRISVVHGTYFILILLITMINYYY